MAVPLREETTRYAPGDGVPRLAGARIPAYALAALEALRFDMDGTGRIRKLDDAGLRSVLAFADPAQLTLTLDSVCGDALAEWVRSRIGRNRRDYAARFVRLENALGEIADEFDRRGIDFLVLKGSTHSPEFTPDPLLRAHGDIDLWVRPPSIAAAQQALLDLGYRPFGGRQERHLPPMIRERDWQWRGDYFASDLPVAVELHHKLWDERMERIPVPGEQDFWNRRETVFRNGRSFPALSLPDTLAFAALHLMMHLLHGDVRLQRAWEIAGFLDRRALDDAFWSGWRRLHPAELRSMEIIIFQLVSKWFGCRLPEAVIEETGALPPDVRLWMERFSSSPIEALFRQNKEELWLQLSLIGPMQDKFAVLVRRLLPMCDPANVAAGAARGSRFAASRALHHARTLVPAIAGGARWYWLRTGLGEGFLRYQAGSTLFCLGTGIFVLLYNLYLLGLGFHEDTLGALAGMTSAGTVAGSLFAARIVRRLGLRDTLLVAILGCAAAACLRALATNGAWLFVTAALHGAFLSLWAVSYSPAIAGLSEEHNRQRAFSLSCAAGMSIGILGGVLGGQLPGWISHVRSSALIQSEKIALLTAAAFAALAVFPMRKLRFAPLPGGDTRSYPRGRFLRAFLVSICCWNLAVGAFNPLMTAFFAGHWRMDVARIGFLYSGGQVGQIAAVLAAPAVLRRLGLVRGVASMQIVTGLALALLAISHSAALAAFLYLGYASFQYMSEPGLFSLLMSRVGPGERSGASALFFVTTSIAGAVAAFCSGAAVSRFGYSAVLIVSAVMAAVAALLFRTVGQDEAVSITSPTAS
jgi:predicted MFS family arabinose efflux permease